ncbi:hypothetical protein [Mariniradius saccharolyticus]|nr:hypothetical protein [Mariniradius saccharolyticus]
MQEETAKWLKSGAPVQEGIRLFCLRSGDKHPFVRLANAFPRHTQPILIQELCRRAGISETEKNRLMDKRGAFRDNWPFLQDPTCPPELKILAANKITAYWNYVNAHRRLFDCRNPEEQLATVKEVVENYIENRMIIAEFLHFQRHGHVLGQHPIFQEFKNYRNLRKMNPIELIKRKTALEHNIWRIESELRKKGKEHLKVDRERRLQRKRNELSEVDRIIASIK